MIKQDNNGEYVSNTKYISLKDQKISKEIECINKEDFYKNINMVYLNNDISVSFSEYEISFSKNGNILCYNAVGDLIYTYSNDETKIDQFLNNPVDISNFSSYHKSFIKKADKIFRFDNNEKDEYSMGDYFVNEDEKRILLKKINGNKLSKYV